MSLLRPGARLCSAVCTTEVVVIAAPTTEMTICCGGISMHATDEQPAASASLDASACAGTALGKRYINEAGDLELLCVKPGDGTLAIAGVALILKGAKPLPASD